MEYRKLYAYEMWDMDVGYVGAVGRCARARDQLFHPHNVLALRPKLVYNRLGCAFNARYPMLRRRRFVRL